MDSEIVATIQGELDQIEATHEVSLLHVIESGSRAWGFPSQTSDYDVRFLYAQPQTCYLSVFDLRDVIEIPVDEVLDINGWDLKKALRLMRKSNVGLLEWLTSPIVYRSQPDATETLRDLALRSFAPRSCFHHYFSMARKKAEEVLTQDTTRTKTYFYTLRPLLCAKWIVEEQSFPPVAFEKLLERFLPQGTEREQIDALIQERKEQSEKANQTASYPTIKALIQEQLTELSDNTPDNTHILLPEAAYDEVFRQLLT